MLTVGQKFRVRRNPHRPVHVVHVVALVKDGDADLVVYKARLRYKRRWHYVTEPQWAFTEFTVRDAI